EVPLRLVEALGVALLVGNLHELAGRVERPRVVEALEEPRVAGVLPTDRRAAVSTGVEEHAHVAVGAADEDDRAAVDQAPAEVAGLLELRLVADVEPAAVEDPLALEVEDFL